VKITKLHPADPAAERAVQELCLRHNVLRLCLFGSASTGRLTDESDLDFLVEFRPMTASRHADTYFGLLADLEILFDRRIDLLESSAIENPYFRRGIEQSQRLMYEAA